MLPRASRTKNSQSPLSFLFLLLNSKGIKLHGNGLSHLTLKVFHLVRKLILGEGGTI